jgi:multiple sugar transport system ATP-binding protein
VAKNMAFGLKVKGVERSVIDKKVKEAGEILQLTALMDRLPKALSGGQRQRVAIGRAIVTEPKVFLFDEPLSNLDAALRVQTRLEIAKLHEDIGTASMIYVTHDQVEAMTLAHKIVLLHAGKLIEERGSLAQVGTPMLLYHRPASLFVAEFIGSPKMNILSARFVRAEPDHAVVELEGQQVTVAVDARHVAPGSAVHLGVRPEHIEVGDTGGGAGLPVLLRHVERLGDVSLLYVDLGNVRPSVLTVRAEGSVRPPTGTRMTLRFLPERLHLFDNKGMACPRTVELPT